MRITSLLLLSLALSPSICAQTFQIPQGGTGATTAAGAFYNLTNGPVNAEAFPGSDIGAQVNAAVASLPLTVPPATRASPFGIVTIKPTNYTFSTPIVINSPYVVIDCQGGFLTYTGTGSAITFMDFPAGNTGTSYDGIVGGFRNCTLLGSSSASAGLTVEETTWFTVQNVHIANFTAGDGILYLNPCDLVYGCTYDGNNYNEQNKLEDVEISNNAIGIEMSCPACSATLPPTSQGPGGYDYQRWRGVTITTPLSGGVGWQFDQYAQTFGDFELSFFLGTGSSAILLSANDSGIVEPHARVFITGELEHGATSATGYNMPAGSYWNANDTHWWNTGPPALADNILGTYSQPIQCPPAPTTGNGTCIEAGPSSLIIHSGGWTGTAEAILSATNMVGNPQTFSFPNILTGGSATLLTTFGDQTIGAGDTFGNITFSGTTSTTGVATFAGNLFSQKATYVTNPGPMPAPDTVGGVFQGQDSAYSNYFSLANIASPNTRWFLINPATNDIMIDGTNDPGNSLNVFGDTGSNDFIAKGNITSTAVTTTSNQTFSTATSGGSCTDSTTYYYRVAAMNALGTALASAETSITTGVSGTNINTVTVKWNNVFGATGYKVYGRTTGAEQLIATVTGNSTAAYTDTCTISPSGNLPTSNTTLGGVTAGTLSTTDGTYGSGEKRATAQCENAVGATTLSTGSTATTTGLTCLPANAHIDDITYRVTTAITGVTSFTIGDSGSATRYSTCWYSGGSQAFTLGATGSCNAGSYQNGGTALGVLITTNANATAGALRITVQYHIGVPPTS